MEVPACFEGPDFIWNSGEGPRVWGVLNLTPDSFHADSRTASTDDALERAQRMESEGAAAIDLGAESTRPGAPPVPAEEEWRRLAPVLRSVVPRVKIPVSVDTYKAETARRAAQEGARIINSVGSIRWDPALAETLLELDLPVVLMHALDRPGRMQSDPRYRDVVEEVAGFLRHDASRLLAGGMSRSRICVDPGICFGKTLEHNLQLLAGLPRLLQLGLPVMVGASRKSFIGKLDGSGGPAQRLGGSLATALVAAGRGVHFIRTHDVAETVQALRVRKALEAA